MNWAGEGFAVTSETELVGWDMSLVIITHKAQRWTILKTKKGLLPKGLLLECIFESGILH